MKNKNKKKRPQQFARLFFIILSIFFLKNNTIAQSNIDSIDLDKVHQKRKKKFIRNPYLNGIVSFNQLIPNCYIKTDSAKYNVQYDEYYIEENINAVWNQYKSIDLNESYSGNLVKFGFLYSKKENKLVYVNDKSYSGMKEGQIVFIRLDLLKGFKKLVVAYEVTDIDDENKSIQFCYMKNGISEGSQKIILSETDKGHTKITHKTFFKSKSKFRDRRIYPGFHKRVVSELHQNLINSLH